MLKALHEIAHNFPCSQNFDPIKQFLYVRRINLMEKLLWMKSETSMYQAFRVSARFSRGMVLKGLQPIKFYNSSQFFLNFFYTFLQFYKTTFKPLHF